ncbi:MAG: transposase [Lentisphaerae bacterium]|jgi:hypothetical protein|nr:transposase [Lentisphaerota bacterium]
MAIIPQPYLFSWREIETTSDLGRLKLVLGVIPDERLVRFLEERRGKGRDDYPVRPCWNALLAGVVFQHVSAASLLRELRRNGELRDLCGFDPFRGNDAVPSEDAFGRFLKLLIDNAEFIVQMFHELVDELATALPDFGKHLAQDGKAVPSHGKPVRDETKASQPDGRRDTDADWGAKKYSGVRDDGTRWEKVTRWFGYKLHLLVDTTYELPVGFSITKASESDTKHLLPLVEETAQLHPQLIERTETTAADRGYDSAENNRELYDKYGIKPVIDSRVGLWKDKESTRPLDPQVTDYFVYDEKGNLYCVCPQTGEQRTLAFAGFEKDRCALKYRCPAAAFDLECKGRQECESRSHVGSFGRTVRVPLNIDRRIFTPIARHSFIWKHIYDSRTGVERVNSRVDILLGFERHYIRGLAKMQMRMTLGLVVMLSMALGRIRLNQSELMRSFVAPVRLAA